MSIKATLKKGDRLVWKLEINDASREGLMCLKDIFSKMGPHGRKYLKKRIETSNPEIKKILKDLGS